MNAPRPKTVQEKLAELSKEELALLRWRLSWLKQARPKQLSPDNERSFQHKPDWSTFGLLTGRGTGKTRSAANWLGLEAAQDPKSINFAIAPTHDDARYTCFEGPTGLYSAIPELLIADANRALPSITLWNGALLRGFAGDTPERLRGPQCARGWIDEFGSFLYPDEALSNFKFGLRLGKHPRLMWTTTPRPKATLKQLIKETEVIYTESLYDNRANLPDSFIADILKYEGTKIGRQEIYGEVIDIEEMGVVKRSDWQLWPWNKPLPAFHFVVMSLDTAFTEKVVDRKTHDPDYTACSVWGLFDGGDGKWCVMLLDFWQDRLTLDELIKRVKKEKQFTYGDQDAPVLKPTYLSKPILRGHFGRPIDLIIIEQQGAGRPLMQMLAAENILTHEYNPGRADKLARLHMVSHMFPHKRVWVVESDNEKRRGLPRSWAEPIISQFCSYAGRGSLPHDDALDSGTQALRFLLEKFTGPVTVIQPKPDKIEVEIAPPRENPYSM